MYFGVVMFVVVISDVAVVGYPYSHVAITHIFPVIRQPFSRGL